jgi:DNA-3-methyladenine glycosylase
MSTLNYDDFSWLSVPADGAARRLLGCELVRQLNGKEIRVRIVETEAYHEADEASHTFNGRTKRNEAMYLDPGHLYVYFIYGMHYCCNIVCGPKDVGAAVLIRAVEPIEGCDEIEALRGMKGVKVTNGPAKLCAALAIDSALDAHDLNYQPLQLVRRPALPDDTIVVAQRIGISKAVDELARFYIKDNKYVSRT